MSFNPIILTQFSNMSKTIKLNPGFVCKKCGTVNPPANRTCRNHCIHCLYSLHVDLTTPGDRASHCQSLMEPLRIDQSGKKGFLIVHKCLKCGKEIPNKSADDDQIDSIIQIIQRQNTGY
jgi:ribosomal protein L40E